MQSTRIARVLIAVATLSLSSFTFAQSNSSAWRIAADTQSSATPAEPKKPILFDTTAIDKTADPCTDFYQYSCGNWVKSNPVPADQVRWGRFNELAERNNWLLYQQL